MAIVILFGIIGLLIAIAGIWECNDWRDFLTVSLNSIATICLIALTAFIGFVFALALPMETKTVVDEYKIVSLQDNNSTSGNFFLGTGYIEGKMKYSFYYENSGEYKMKQTDINNTSIIYSDSIICKRYRQVAVDGAFINYFALDELNSESEMKYIIYVPKGTIKTSFSLDAQ